ncbi:MAG: hypothetical protein R3F59_27010 [Myxococcota bacterium]
MHRVTVPLAALLSTTAGGCIIDLQLAGVQATSEGGATTVDDSYVMPPAAPGSCDAGLLRRKQTLASHATGTDNRQALVPFTLRGGWLAESTGKADDRRDLVWTMPCGPRCGEGGQLNAEPGGDPYLADRGGGSVGLGTPGRGLQLLTCDLDGDGVDEVVVADPSEDDSVEVGQSGLTENVVSIWWHGDISNYSPSEVTGLAGDTSVGRVLGCGDLDGDGQDDLVYGTDQGILGLRGGDDTLPLLLDLPLDGPVEALAVGDADGDGHADLAYAVGGRLFRWDGVREHDEGLGNVETLTALGDLDLDGKDELAVGRADRLEVRKGGDGWDVEGWYRKGRWENAVGVGDLDGNGFGELAIATAGPPDNAGRVEVYPVLSTGVSVYESYACTGMPGEELGMGFANLGDLDGDGLDELVVSRRRRDRPVDFEIYAAGPQGR